MPQPLIDKDYFILNVNLPQASISEGISLIDKYIARYETDFLDKALGYELSKAFRTGISGPTESSYDQRWIDILSGAEYSYGDLTDRWMGMRDSTKKISPIANYVFCKFIKEKATDNTLVGVSKPKQSNATREDGETKFKDAWNEMVKWMRNLREFLYVNQSTYPEWKYQRGEIYETTNVWGL